MFQDQEVQVTFLDVGYGVKYGFRIIGDVGEEYEQGELKLEFVVYVDFFLLIFKQFLSIFEFLVMNFGEKDVSDFQISFDIVQD